MRKYGIWTKPVISVLGVCDETDSVSRLGARLSHTFLPHNPIQSLSLIRTAVNLFHRPWEQLSISRYTTEKEIQG